MSRVTPGPIIQARLHPISGPRPPPPASNIHRSLLQQPMSAVPEPPSHSESFSTTHALTLILTVVLLVLFFVGFFSIYFCRCFMENIISIFNNRGRNPMGTPVNPSNPDPPGLNLNIIETFPAFDYSSVKDYRPESYSLECAICLSEFQEDDALRLIPDCCHVFHKDCIDLWLASHKSCPVCRRSLDPDPLPDDDGPDSGQGPDPDPNTPDDDIEACGPGDEGSSSYSITVKEEPPWQRFSRSHSTGHSIVRVSGGEERAGAATGEDKYTLRLPEHVIKETITRGHVQTLSCTTFGEMCRGSAQGRSCFGEISGGYNGSCSGDAKQ